MTNVGINTLYRRREPLLKSLLWPKKFKKSASSTLSHSGYVSGIPTTGSSGAIMAESEQDYYYGGGGSSYYYQTFYDEDHTQVRMDSFHSSLTFGMVGILKCCEATRVSSFPRG